MILQLRQRHRRMFAVIGVALPIAFAVGIVGRKPVPGVTSLSAALSASSSQFSETLWLRGDMFENAPVEVRLLRDSGRGRVAVALTATQDFVKPDLLVYWAASAPAATEKLPDSATLLGAFSAGQLGLSAEVANGVLILFSLADQEIVAVSKPVRFTEAER